MSKLNILIACEESQKVCIEFRKLGYNAFSCDIQSESGGYPEWHIQGDVIPILNGKCEFKTADDVIHNIDKKWDLIIAFPPCTDLAVSGARHFDRKIKDGTQQKSIDFFMKIANSDCEYILIENPVGIMSTKWRKPDQIIQPYYFGDPYRKKTCLWLKNLPNLKKTNIVEVCDLRTYTSKTGKTGTYSEWYIKGGKDRQKNRSKTFSGIAKAIAEQYSNYLKKVLTNIIK